ncbi:MAG: ribonuclease P protein component [Candidatus Bipolaricaulota bacterium]|nr:ribonuclease P protein component [Candidatus Bipolaricaulota bacterium]
MSFTFPRTRRIRRRCDFEHIYEHGQLYQDALFRIFYVRKSPTEPGRLGISVGKKLGKAHVRNRLKRILREAFRLHPELTAGLDVIIQPRPEVLALTNAQISRRFVEALAALSSPSPPSPSPLPAPLRKRRRREG